MITTMTTIEITTGITTNKNFG